MPSSYEVIEESAFKTTSHQDIEKFLHVAVAAEAELLADLEKVRRAIAILREKQQRWFGKQADQQLSLALQRDSLEDL